MEGEELRAIRHKLSLSQRKFAPQLGIHWNTLARLERAEVRVTPTVAILARLLLHLAKTEQQGKRRRNPRE